MSEHDEHSSFIKTPQQLITVVLLAFLIPIFGIIALVHLVVDKPHADPGALSPEAVAARIKPVGTVEIGAPEIPGAKGGEEIVKEVCSTCHVPGIANAPKIGDKAAWAPRIALGLDHLLGSVVKGKGAMAPRAGTSLTDQEITRAIIFMTGQSGGNFKEPAAKPAAAAPKK